MNATSTSPAADSQPDTQSSTESSATADPRPAAQTLRRPVEGRMVAGVAGAIADFLGVDVTVVRIVLTALTVVGGAGLPVYLAGWLLIPEEGRDNSIAGEFLSSHQARSH